MIITIPNKDNKETAYDVSKVTDEGKKAEAKIRISKIGTLNVLVEALNFASQEHSSRLESLLAECTEAVVKQEEQTVEESEGDSK
jgi:hypothetical protein|tara:strand:+ start:2842 stop:3096 length:255 start_codon:yes stop_codon:yes gene_type:complete